MRIAGIGQRTGINWGESVERPLEHQKLLVILISLFAVGVFLKMAEWAFNQRHYERVD